MLFVRVQQREHKQGRQREKETAHWFSGMGCLRSTMFPVFVQFHFLQLETCYFSTSEVSCPMGFFSLTCFLTFLFSWRLALWVFLSHVTESPVSSHFFLLRLFTCPEQFSPWSNDLKLLRFVLGVDQLWRQDSFWSWRSSSGYQRGGTACSVSGHWILGLLCVDQD